MYKNWYKDWFGDEYLQVYAHRDAGDAREMIEFIRGQISISASDRVLDLCCGNGRHSRLISESGCKVVGLDLSPQLLDEANCERYLAIGNSYVRGDMRCLPFAKSFDLLINLFTSFGYFENDEENRIVFDQYQQALKPGGKFVFDYLNATNVERNLVPYHCDRIGDLKVEQERFIEGSRVIKRIRLSRGGVKDEFHEAVKLYSADDIIRMMRSCGLRPLNVFGNTDGSPISDNSPRLIIIGENIGTTNN